MRKVEKIWAELSKGKKGINLSSNKRNVKLNAIQEIENVRGYSETAMSEASYIIQELMPEMEDKCYEIQMQVDNIIVNSEANALEDFANDLEQAIEVIEKSASDLGIDAEEIYDEIDEARRELDFMRSLQGDWDDLEREYPLVYRLTNLK